MLFSANSDVRLHAAQLVGATPFRWSLADAFCAELRKRDTDLAGPLLDALPFVAGAAHRPTVELMVTAAGLPGSTASAAAWAIAHLPGTSSDHFWGTALRRADCRRGLIYALGITGQQAWLAGISGDAGMPGEARTAARWWSNLPTALTRDAHR
jgi:hypothetical protein